MFLGHKYSNAGDIHFPLCKEFLMAWISETIEYDYFGNKRVTRTTTTTTTVVRRRPRPRPTTEEEAAAVVVVAAAATAIVAIGALFGGGSK
ncbi:MAG: hypothetical protein EB075_13295 [Bacteroidetes bacterium]|nr:hypothetical protein [Bacteroidota bacterium]